MNPMNPHATTRLVCTTSTARSCQTKQQMARFGAKGGVINSTVEEVTSICWSMVVFVGEKILAAFPP